MDGEENGTQANQPQEEKGEQAAQGALSEGEGAGAGDKGAKSDAKPDYESAIAERDKTIADLQAQIAEAAKSQEKSDELTKQIEDLKAEQAAEREEFALKMAGVRNVTAARALLGQHDGDVDKLKEAEPWLFEVKQPKQTRGKTGLEPKGAAVNADKQLKHWREIAGLTDEE